MHGNESVDAERVAAHAVGFAHPTAFAGVDRKLLCRARSQQPRYAFRRTFHFGFHEPPVLIVAAVKPATLLDGTGPQKRLRPNGKRYSVPTAHEAAVGIVVSIPRVSPGDLLVQWRQQTATSDVASGEAEEELRRSIIWRDLVGVELSLAAVGIGQQGRFGPMEKVLGYGRVDVSPVAEDAEVDPVFAADCVPKRQILRVKSPLGDHRLRAQQRPMNAIG